MLVNANGTPIKANGSAGDPMPADPRPIVAFCFPMQDTVKAGFFMAACAAIYSARVRPILIRGSSSAVHVARNHCLDKLAHIEEMGHFNVEWTMWIDSDMDFPPDTVGRLLAHGRDIVGATYVRRAPPFDIMGQTLSGRPEDIIEHGLMEVKRLPSGCMLVRRDVFRRMKRPFFRWVFDEEVDGVEYKEGPSEDYTFFDVAAKLGYRVWLDVDLTKEVGHIGEWVFKPQEAPGPNEAGDIVKTEWRTLGEPSAHL